MRKIVFGALMFGLLAACGGSKSNNNPDGPIVVVPDAPDQGTCNPTLQTGCDTGQKCTWVRISATSTSQIGQLGCVADGTVALNDACTYGAAGAATGFDNCKKGLICLASSRTDMAGGTCSTICDIAAVAGAAGACPTNYACGRYSNFFENKTDTTTTSTGLCDPTCDPLTQKRDSDGAVDCGGGRDANGDALKTCVGFPAGGGATSQFTCGDAVFPLNKSDAFAYDQDTGFVYTNSCAAGYLPLLYDSTADGGMDMKVICVALCAPADTSTAAKANAGGVSPHTCAAAGATGSHECHYWWTLEFDQSGVPATMSKFSNGLGYCYDYTHYTYDGTMDHPATSATQPRPGCQNLSNTTMTFDADTGGQQTVPDNVWWGCTAEAAMFTGGATPHAKSLSPFRPLLSHQQMESLVKAWN